MSANSPDTYPDIEIYLHQVPRAEIIDWLSTTFAKIQQVNKDSSSTSLTAEFQRNNEFRSVDIVIVEHASKGFTGLWFKTNWTPWQNDHECALAASAYFEKEIRCTKGPWDNSQEQDEWYSIIKSNESVIVWDH